jgi:hypothetical protein
MLLAVLGIVGHNGHGPEYLMNPSNQAQAPISGIQADDSGMDLIELFGPCQQAVRKGSIMKVGRRKQEEEWES